MIKSQSGSSVEDTDEKYAHLWFESLCKFHIIPDNQSQQWNFDEKHVLAYGHGLSSRGTSAFVNPWARRPCNGHLAGGNDRTRLDCHVGTHVPCLA